MFGFKGALGGLQHKANFMQLYGSDLIVICYIYNAGCHNISLQ